MDKNKKPDIKIVVTNNYYLLNTKNTEKVQSPKGSYKSIVLIVKLLIKELWKNIM